MAAGEVYRVRVPVWTNRKVITARVTSICRFMCGGSKSLPTRSAHARRGADILGRRLSDVVGGNR